MYGETLGRWRTADLLIGLAYLARRENVEHPVADIARAGVLAGKGGSAAERDGLLVGQFRSLSLINMPLVTLFDAKLKAAKLECLTPTSLSQGLVMCGNPRSPLNQKCSGCCDAVDGVRGMCQ